MKLLVLLCFVGFFEGVVLGFAFPQEDKDKTLKLSKTFIDSTLKYSKLLLSEKFEGKNILKREEIAKIGVLLMQTIPAGTDRSQVRKLLGEPILLIGDSDYYFGNEINFFYKLSFKNGKYRKFQHVETFDIETGK